MGTLFQVALAAFIYFVAGAEESSVLAEERKRAYYTPQGEGIWTAPLAITGCSKAMASGNWLRSS